MNDPRTDDTTTAPVDSGAVEIEAPLPTFDALPLSDEVRRAIAEMGYENPTPVQLAVWDPATRGRDAVVQARTGTGKTASFGLPIVDHVVKRSSEGVQALVLTPTRELALQVSAELERLGKYKGTKVTSIYGGAPMDRQIAALEAGAQVVVGTPGRVLDHLRRKTLNTSGVRLLVLDEADEMLSMGFERELNAIVDTLPPTRQTLLFSATVPPDIERIARSRLKDPEFVTLSGDHIGALSIQHLTYLVTSDKIAALVGILDTENPESALIFCNTKDQTEAVSAALVGRGYDADWLNGDLAQSDRERVMTATRTGKLRFLVATDVAARGIDLSHLTHVINFDFPMDAETYVHRTGRTGRAGRTGTAISLVLPQDIGGLYLLRLTYKIRPIERIVPSKSELKTRAEADLVGMLADALLPKGSHEDDRALARRFLTHDQIEGILAGLLREYLGARPKAQEEATSTRQKTGRRATFKRGEPRGEIVRPPLPVPSATLAALPAPVAESPTLVAAAAPALHSHSNGPSTRVAEPVAGGLIANATPVADGFRERGPRDRDRPAGDRGRGRGPVGQRGADDRPRDDRPRDDRPRDDRPREDLLTGDRSLRDRDHRRSPAAGIGPNSPVRDFAAWSPPEEAGDDEPLLPSKPPPAAPQTASQQPAAAAPPAPQRAKAEPSLAFGAPPVAEAQPLDDGSYVELFMGVGRRDGVRAQDLLRVLVDAGVDKDHVRRIRVRDRHAFVAVRREEANHAAGQLNGSSIAGKAAVTVELARERPPEDPPQEAPAG